MTTETRQPSIDALLDQWRAPLGGDFTAYRNHVYRVFNLTARMAAARGDALEKIAVAAAFHDIGIWLAGTFDYLQPSVDHACTYLSGAGREAWRPEIEAMIQQHHKLTPWKGASRPLVESFRRADWLDVCLFALPTRLPRRWLSDLLTAFPRKGFHLMLCRMSARWTLHHPMRPLPMFKW
jgi:hypothetical protein